MLQNELIADRYRICRSIGRGGMGTVWLCRDEVLDRDVAIKQIGSLPGEEDGAARARREARLAASLNHPNAVSIYDVIEHDGKPWLVMEYVPALNLSQIIKSRGSLPPHEVAAIAAQIARALAAAHKRGIVHRDVKPSNILVDDYGVAKITDFGIAKANTDPQLTRTGMMAGTPAYFSPELARGRTPSPSSDVWALGATIFHATEGVPPYGLDENTIAMLYRIGVDEPARAQHAGILAPALGHLLDVDTNRRWSMAMAADKLGDLANPGANLSVSDATSAEATTIEPRPGRGPDPRAAGAPYAGPYGPPTGPVTGAPATGGHLSAAPHGASFSAGPVTGAPLSGAPITGGYSPPPDYGMAYSAGGGMPPSGPMSYPAIAVPEPGRKSRRGLITGVAAAAAVVIGLAVVLLIKGGSEKSDAHRADAGAAASSSNETSESAPPSSAQPSDQFASPTPAPQAPSASPSQAPTTQGTPAPDSDPQAEAQAMEVAVEDYYSLLPGDMDAAYEHFLTGGLKSNYQSYVEFWSTVISVSCSDYQADTSNSTVSMYCIYDMPDKVVEQNQTAQMTKLDDGMWYLSGMSKSGVITTPK